MFSLVWVRWVRAKCERFGKCLAPMAKVADTVERHLEGIVAHWAGNLSTAFLEGLNSVFSAVKRKARGYRSTEYDRDALLRGRQPKHSFLVQTNIQPLKTAKNHNNGIRHALPAATGQRLKTKKREGTLLRVWNRLFLLMDSQAVKPESHQVRYRGSAQESQTSENDRLFKRKNARFTRVSLANSWRR